MSELKNDKESNTRSLSKWFMDKPYTKAMYLNAFATIVMAIVSVVMVWAIYQNKLAIEVATESLNIQKSEFRLRNRPWLSFEKAQLSGPAQDLTLREFPHTISVRIMNVGSLPAIVSKNILRGILDEKEVKRTEAEPISIASNQICKNHLFLTEDIYNKIISGNHRFEVTSDVTYAGPLDNEPNTFQLKTTTVYLQNQGEFEITESVFE